MIQMIQSDDDGKKPDKWNKPEERTMKIHGNLRISTFAIIFLLLLGMAAAQLEIDADSVLIEINEEPAVVDEFGDFVVSPGNEVALSFTITNTGAETLGYVSTTIETVDGIIEIVNGTFEVVNGTGTGAEIEGIELPEDHECTEEDCSTGYWALPAEDVKTETYAFTIFRGLDPDIRFFTIILEAFHDGNPDDEVDDIALIGFRVSREDGAVLFENVELRPSTVSCGTATGLRFNMVNTGDREILPELRVYDRRGTSFDAVRGVYEFTPDPDVQVEVPLRPIAPEQGSVPVPLRTIDVSGLAQRTTPHTLFLYLVSPFFGPDEDGFFVSDSEEVSLTRAACITASTPAQAAIFAVQDETVDFTATLAEADSPQWFVDDTEQPAASGNTAFSTSFSSAGPHTVEVRAGGDARTWNIEVGESREAALTVSEIFFDNVNRDTTVNTTIIITNEGTTDELSSVSFSFVGVNAARYSPRLLGTLPTEIPARSAVEVQLELTIPVDEASGRHSIGSLRVSSDQDTETASISIAPRSFLVIERVKLNGKTNGDLSVEDLNEFKVKVRNDYTEDMEDITVTVTILDVDGEDLEKESGEFDLRTGKDKEVTLSFSLLQETVDESEYAVEIEVEGDAEDDTSHRTVETISFSVERERHRVIISKAALSQEAVQCIRQTSLQVEVKNIGRDEEDDVEVKVHNEALGIALRRGAIELEDYTDDRDSEFDTSFSLNLEDADAGTYPLAVEVYLDGELEDSEEKLVEVRDCAALSVVTQTQEELADQDLVAELEEQLEQSLQSRKEEQKQPSVTASLRESPLYVPLLGVVIVLVVLAGLLLIGLALKRRPAAL